MFADRLIPENRLPYRFSANSIFYGVTFNGKVNMRALDLTGKKFGRLTVIKRVVKHDGRKNRTYWFCECECGNSKEIQHDVLQRGTCYSCGCYRREMSRKHATKHGHYHDAVYKIWKMMLYRCQEDSKHIGAKYYSERGITVCERWTVYENFVEDMGERPDGATLERIDNSKGYEPSNVRWATPRENSNNTRSNRLLTYNGKTQTVTQWAAELGLNYNTISGRLFKGWPIEKVLCKSLRNF